MYLRAEHVTMDFPLDASVARKTAGAGKAEQLGGNILRRGRKAYIRALEDINIDLASGDRLALIGHNGSGKSTLLRTLAGVYHPSAGMVRSSSNVSGIFNMSLGFRHEASGYRNLVLKGLMAGYSRAQVDALLPEIAEFTGLGPYLDMPLHGYSQGMAMRLAFAATTALSNDILVLDEWIGAGDAAFQEKIINRMEDVVDSSRILVVASHSTALLRRIANQALWLEHGCVKMAGDVDHVIEAYEGTITPAGLSSPELEALHKGKGMWLSDQDDHAYPTPHLLWNLQRSTANLQLYLHDDDGSRTVVRRTVQRMGAWQIPHWARPGMSFELCDREGRDSAARFTLPDCFQGSAASD